MDLKDAILSKNWIWFWSGNWPLLNNLHVRDKLYQMEFRKIVGDFPRLALDFYKDGVLTAYHAQEEYDRLGRHFLNKLRSDPKFMLRLYKDYEKNTKKDIEEMKKIFDLSIETLTNQKLVSLFKKSRKYLAYNSAYDHITWYCEKFFLPLLENFVKKYIDDSNEIANALTLLVTPQKKSRVFKERTNFFSLIRKINSNVVWKEIFRNNLVMTTPDHELHAMLDEHIENYCYLTVLVNNPAMTKEQLIYEIRSFVADNKRLGIESTRLGDIYDPSIKQKVLLLLKKLNPTRNILYLIKGLRETAFIRTEDNAVMSESSFLLIPLLEEIAKRIGISYIELKDLVPEEVIYYLKYHLKVSKQHIKNRRDACGHYIEKDEIFFFASKTAKELKQCLEKNNEIVIVGVLKGHSASPGKVSGRAFVAKSSVHDLTRFEEGDILVAPATSADFVPIMRESSAVVTEMGGITSHAAIVSREFGIPCIVGVKSATSAIKTGDIIEVDAEKGIVKKI